MGKSGIERRKGRKGVKESSTDAGKLKGWDVF